MMSPEADSLIARIYSKSRRRTCGKNWQAHETHSPDPRLETPPRHHRARALSDRQNNCPRPVAQPLERTQSSRQKAISRATAACHAFNGRLRESRLFSSTARVHFTLSMARTTCSMSRANRAASAAGILNAAIDRSRASKHESAARELLVLRTLLAAQGVSPRHSVSPQFLTGWTFAARGPLWLVRLCVRRAHRRQHPHRITKRC